jgi:protein Mpv17
MAALPLGWKPVFKAALTSASVMAVGDALCQALRCRAANQDISLDLKQTARFGFIGLTLHGPYFYHSFRWLDKTLGQSTTFRKAALKTALGQVTIFPIYVATFFTYMGLLEGLSLDQCKEKVIKAAPPTLITGTAFWPVVNFFNFLYIPPAGRVLYVNAAGLFWNAWLSYENTTKGQVERTDNSGSGKKE